MWRPEVALSSCFPRPKFIGDSAHSFGLQQRFSRAATMKDVRVTFSRRHAYATKSNVLKVVKTPGGRLVGAYRSKKRQGPKCGDCGTPLPGIKHLSSFAYKNTHKRERTVSRAYGGSRCAKCVRQRVVRAFLIEEQKIVKQMMIEKQKKTK